MDREEPPQSETENTLALEEPLINRIGPYLLMFALLEDLERDRNKRRRKRRRKENTITKE